MLNCFSRVRDSLLFFVVVVAFCFCLCFWIFFKLSPVQFVEKAVHYKMFQASLSKSFSLDPLFIGVCVWFGTSTMLFLFIYLSCIIIRSNMMPNIPLLAQHCCGCSVCFVLPLDFMMSFSISSNAIRILIKVEQNLQITFRNVVISTICYQSANRGDPLCNVFLGFFPGFWNFLFRCPSLVS